MTATTMREDLGRLTERLRMLRGDLARARSVADAAKRAADAVPDGAGADATLRSAERAVKAVREIEAEIERVSGEQSEKLGHLGDHEAGWAPIGVLTGDPWAQAVQAIDLGAGKLRAEVPSAAVTQPASARSFSNTTDSTPAPPQVRWLFPILQQSPFGSSAADLATTEVRISFLQEELTGRIAGPIERDPDDIVTQKPTMTPNVSLATVEAKTYAAVLAGVPSKVWDAFGPAKALLQGELARQLAETLDNVVISAIEADPLLPSGSSGSDLVAKIRNGIAMARDYGAEPQYVALTRSDSAALDLTEDTAGHLIFNVKAANGGDGVWSLRVREANVEAPLLVDPEYLGVLYGESMASLVVDPYSGLTTNMTRARLEFDARWHTRCVQLGAFQIS